MLSRFVYPDCIGSVIVLFALVGRKVKKEMSPGVVGAKGTC
jgi:hypothetical protein